MKQTLFTRFLVTSLVACAVACTPPSPTTNTTNVPEKVASATPSATTASTPAAPSAFPDPLNEQKSLEVGAKGVQIYTCGPKKDSPEQFEWSLKAPEAELTDSKGYKVGTHYGSPDGPVWESNDGSKVVGDRSKAQSKPAPDSIPWLLLPTKSTAGKGVFGAVKSIQRLNTTGGKAPETGCDKANAGKEVRVDYTAAYYFYIAKP